MSGTPIQAEDPFADLSDSLPPPPATGKDEGQGYVWKVGGAQDDDALAVMTSDQPNVAPAPPPTKIKILKRRNTTDRKTEGSAIVTPTTEDLESRAKEKELEYQRARERILGNDADTLLNNAATPPQRSTTNSPSASGGPGVSSGSVTPSNSGNHTPGPGGESFTSTTSSVADANASNPTSTSFNSNRGKQRSPVSTPAPNPQEDMSEYRRMPVAYVPTGNPNAPTYTAIPYTPTPPPAGGPVPAVYPSPHSTFQPPAVAWDPSSRPPIGYVHLPGLPAYPIPPPPSVDHLRAMRLPPPRNPPPFRIYPPMPNAMPPFILLPLPSGAPANGPGIPGPGAQRPSPATSLNASRTASPALSAAGAAAAAKASPARTPSAASNPGAVIPSDATAGTAAGLLERQMAGMQLGASGMVQPQPHAVYAMGAPAPRAFNGGGGGAAGTSRGQMYSPATGLSQPMPQQQQQQHMGGAEVRRSRSGASNRGRGRLWKPSS